MLCSMLMASFGTLDMLPGYILKGSLRVKYVEHFEQKAPFSFTLHPRDNSYR